MASSPRIDELRKKFEENPRRYFAPLANEYRKAGDVQQAIAICREYLPQQPGHMSGHIVFGQALYEARTFEEAKAVFETALSLDPENLIALRHLGDISLITGDSDSAKTWYMRVLEADPRNEEIQAQLATIDKAAASAPTPAITPAVAEAPPAPPAPPAPAAPASTAATIVMKAVPRPGSPPVTPTSPTAEIDVETISPPAPAPIAEPTLEVPGFQMPEPEPAAPASQLEGLEATHTAAADEAPNASFSLDGLESTSFSPEAAPPPSATLADLDFGPAGAPPPAPASADSAPTVELDFGTPAATADAPPAQLPDLDFAPPPPAPVPAVSAAEDEPPALDLDLGSLGAPAAVSSEVPDMAVAAPVASSGADSADDAPLDLDLSLPDPTPVAAPLQAPPAAHAEPLAPAPAPAVEDVEPLTPAATSAPFVTETMAELYLQQGHREEALNVYRALLSQRPDDQGLRDKIASLDPAAAAPAPAAPAVALARDGGPTIRELLVAIATRRPGYRPELPSTNGARADAPSSAPEAVGPAPQPGGESGQSGDRGDALGASLGLGAATSQDEAAAVVLASAFSGNGHGAHAPLLDGMPARPASDELSLRTVFRDAEPAPAPSSFSFDQFFSKRASAEHPAVPPEGQAAESAEDVAHFTQWLEGLKKR